METEFVFCHDVYVCVCLFVCMMCYGVCVCVCVFVCMLCCGVCVCVCVCVHALMTFLSSRLGDITVFSTRQHRGCDQGVAPRSSTRSL